MIIAIQQPEHFPWIGFFNKMLQVDKFVYLDNVQFKKRYFENRNRIRTDNICGWQWVTVPVITKGHYSQNINQVRIDYSQKWQKKYLNKVRFSYSKASFFEDIFTALEEIISREYDKLVELNTVLINYVTMYLNIKTAVILASEICEGKGSNLILNLCTHLGADTYLSGPDGRNYLELNKFNESGITIKYHDYNHSHYGQVYEPFISHMSTLDLLFNCGKGSLSIIKGK